ncbi:unnamed protein product [Staurois parvus]|uniref:Uncharacterized protein n=1 Tax=Staurois parvus TaxID=386267 RepID=A0ABN9CDJ6_9NEOB|nr:unnamed protein product [Staurois parvus]
MMSRSDILFTTIHVIGQSVIICAAIGGYSLQSPCLSRRFLIGTRLSPTITDR